MAKFVICSRYNTVPAMPPRSVAAAMVGELGATGVGEGAGRPDVLALPGLTTRLGGEVKLYWSLLGC